MPIIESSYTCRAALRNGHIQTILPFILKKKTNITGIKTLHQTPDGDRLTSIHYKSPGSKKLVIITHGLEGTAEDPAIISLAKSLVDSHFSTLTWSMRSCDGEINVTDKFYNACDYEDLSFIIDAFAKDYDEISLVGISLGGSLTANYLGREGNNIHPKITKGCLISTPLDLQSSKVSLEGRVNRMLYHRVFIKSIRKKIIEKSKIMDLPVDLDLISKTKLISDFDDTITSPLYGYKNGEHYRELASCLPHLNNAKVPIYILNAKDDPFLGELSFPYQLAKSSKLIHLESPKYGGHVGFITKLDEPNNYYELSIIKFLENKK